MARADAGSRVLTRPFVFAFVANTLHGLAFFTLLHLPGLLEQLGADAAQIGVIVATMAVTAIAARPLIGRAMDRRGRRIVMLVGGVLNVAACLAYLTVQDLGPRIYAVRVLHGLADGMLFSVMFTIAADIVPADRRTEGMSLFGISGMLPMSLGALLGEWVLGADPSATGYAGLFWVAAACSTVGLLLSTTLPDSRPVTTSHGPPTSFSAAAFAPSLRPLWWVGSGFAFALASYFTFMKTYVLDRELSSVGQFFTIYSVTAIVLRLGLGWVPDRLGPKVTLFPSIACSVLGLGLLAVGASDPVVWTAALLCGVGHGFAFPILSVLVVTRAKPGDRGTAMSMFTALFDVGLLVGGPTLGLLLRATDRDYGAMFGVAAGVLVLVTLTYGAWDRRGAEVA